MRCDVTIAGAGIIGASVAWRLAQKGLRVTLLDAGRMGGEASSAGAGMLAPGGEFEERSLWHDLAIESLSLYPGFVAELQEETGVPIDFQRLGGIELAVSHPDWAALQTRGERQAALGIPSCPLSPEDLLKHAPLARQEVAGALFYPQDALVDPRDIMTSLRAACLGREVDIREGVRVTGIQPRADTVRIQTAEGEIESLAAVLAAGAWSSEIPVEGLTLPRAYPVRGHLIGFHLEPHSLGPVLRCGHTYVLQRSSGLMVAGSSSEEAGFDRTLDSAIAADIHARAVGMVPTLAHCLPAERWLGFRPAVEGGQLALGRAGNTALWLAYGHYRNGILMAPATAQRLARSIISREETGLSVPPGTP